MKILSLMICSAFVAFSGCAKKDDPLTTTKNKKLEVGDKIQSNSDVNEIIAVKYKKIDLTCSIWSKQSNSIDVKDLPNETITIDLLKNVDSPKQIKLTSETKLQKIEFVLDTSLFNIYSESKYTDFAGNSFEAKYTPEIKVSMQLQRTTQVADKRKISNYVEKRIALKEMAAIILDSSKDDLYFSDTTNENNKIVSVVSCQIVTDIRKEYEDQLKITPVK